MQKIKGLLIMMSRLIRISTIHDAFFYLADFFNCTEKSSHKYILRGNIPISVRNGGSDRSEMVNILSGHEYGELEDYVKNYHLEINTVIDAGANIGLFSIYIAKKLKLSCRLFLIEPDSDNLIYLKRNLIQNNIPNYKIYDKALYKEKTTIKFNNTLEFDSRKIDVDNGGTLVKTVTLESIFNENNLSKLDLLKMDIEGGEWCLFTKKNYKYFCEVKLIILEYHLDKFNKDIAVIEKYFVDFKLNISKANTNSGIIYLLNNNA